MPHFLPFDVINVIQLEGTKCLQCPTFSTLFVTHYGQLGSCNAGCKWITVKVKCPSFPLNG